MRQPSRVFLPKTSPEASVSKVTSAQVSLKDVASVLSTDKQTGVNMTSESASQRQFKFDVSAKMINTASQPGWKAKQADVTAQITNSF